MLPTTRNIDNTGGSTYNATTGSSTASPAGATMASNNSVPSDTKSIPAPQLSGRPLRSAAANPSHGQSGSLLSSGTTSIPSKPAPVGSAPLNPPIQTTLLATNPVVPTPPNSNTAQPPVDPTQTSTQVWNQNNGTKWEPEPDAATSPVTCIGADSTFWWTTRTKLARN
ncbi:hypothetical protein BJ508DRAFT_13655 [Ascobolus immersus RN42]|uniref:Uncharacterized protein n=1 Tax=Ascobolus immersus RN42 TaxID=1160509 RepID=A0A3N4IU84_ASCIM|nr:hypothetical protein BJ508DRAFT_13655 [Ascobolus immersus RN42]